MNFNFFCPIWLILYDESLEELLKALKQEGLEIVGEMETYPCGKFGWIMDPEGNKIELWEPADEGNL